MVGGHQLLIAASDILQAGIVGKSFRLSFIHASLCRAKWIILKQETDSNLIEKLTCQAVERTPIENITNKIIYWEIVP